MRNIKLTLLALLFTLLLFNFSAYAGCMSDCKDNYESEVDSCNLLWGDDPEDSFMLKLCIEDAKDEYESCKEECLS